MAFDLAPVEAQLKLIEWRNRQRENITEHLEAAFPALLDAIEKRVNGMSALEFSRASLNPKKVAEELTQAWAEKQVQVVFARAEASLAEVMAALKADSRYSDHVRAALPAFAGIGLMAGSVLGLPSVVSFATVTTTSFFFFTTSSISVPMLLAGGTVLAGLSVAGVKVFDKSNDMLRGVLIKRVRSLAEVTVFGYGLKLPARCFLDDVQLLVDKATEGTLLEAR